MISALGRGINLRRSFLSELSERLSNEDPLLKSQLDWVELVPESFMGRGGLVRRDLLQISECLPATLHGVTLSIGSSDPLNWGYLQELKKFSREIKAAWATDHVSYSSVNGVQFHNLLPLPFTEEALAHTVTRVKQVQNFLEIPFGLENPSFYTMPPDSEMSELEFITRLIKESGCHLLLDLNNVYVNSYNQVLRNELSGDAAFENEAERVAEATRISKEWILRIPAERVLEVHVAGHDRTTVGDQQRLIDTHGTRVSAPVLGLVNEFHRAFSLTTLLLEREREVPPLEKVLEELNEVWQGFLC